MIWPKSNHTRRASCRSASSVRHDDAQNAALFLGQIPHHNGKGEVIWSWRKCFRSTGDDQKRRGAPCERRNEVSYAISNLQMHCGSCCVCAWNFVTGPAAAEPRDTGAGSDRRALPTDIELKRPALSRNQRKNSEELRRVILIWEGRRGVVPDSWT